MSKLSRDELLQLIPVYVVDALEDEERSQVEALLAMDEEARRLEADYRQVQMILPLSVKSQQAPSEVKDRLFKQIHEDKIEPDTVGLESVPRKEKRKVIQHKRRYILPFVAAFGIIIVGFALVLTNRDESESPYTVFRELYNQPYTEKVYVSDSGQSPTEGTLVIAEDGDKAVLRVEQVPVLEDNQVFQLWLVEPNEVNNGGTYLANERSELYIVVPNEYPINRYSRFGISIEPTGGSPLGNAPSGDRVFSVDIPE